MTTLPTIVKQRKDKATPHFFCLRVSSVIQNSANKQHEYSEYPFRHL